MADTGVQQDSTTTMFANLLEIAVGTIVAHVSGAVDSPSTENQQKKKKTSNQHQSKRRN